MFRFLPILLALALASPAADAQGMYRSVMPDGKIIYSDKPPPGAKESTKLNLAPLNVATPPPAPDTPQRPTPADGVAVDKTAAVAAARQRLEAAQKALADGREQREGDRIGVAKGGAASSRLSESYLDRVKALEDSVAAAQQQLDAAQRAAAGR